MGIFSELDIENQQNDATQTQDQTAARQAVAQALLIQRHEQKKADAAEKPNVEFSTKPAMGKAEQNTAAADEDEKRRRHEETEAQRKADWERRQQEKRDAEQAAITKLDQMSETELIQASMARMKQETERLTRRNLKECVSEYVQTLCIDDPNFARRVMHPRKSMAHCLQFINRKAREYLLEEMKDNGMEQPNGIYGGDVPEDTCYDWAEAYFRDENAKEDEVKEEKFVPKPYPGAASPKTKRQPKAEKMKAEKAAAKPAPVIRMPAAEQKPDEQQVSMLDLMGGMAG